jgi:glyoxylase I family protein
MPQPEGKELDQIRARRDELRERYLRPAADRQPSTVQGVHHLALICRDTEETIRFYQEFLPGHDHPAFTETIGGVQHLAISISAEQFETARKKFQEAGLDYLGPDRGVEDSMYFRDPNGIGLELYREELGIFNGHRILD